MYVTHFAVQQKLIQHCKSTILQFKKKTMCKNCVTYKCQVLLRRNTNWAIASEDAIMEGGEGQTI